MLGDLEAPACFKDPMQNQHLRLPWPPQTQFCWLSPFLSQTDGFLSKLPTLADGWGSQGFRGTGFPLTAITLSYRLYWQYLTQICFPSLSDPTSVCTTGEEVECWIDFLNANAESNPSGDALVGLQWNLFSLAFMDSPLCQKHGTLLSSFT